MAVIFDISLCHQAFCTFQVNQTGEQNSSTLVAFQIREKESCIGFRNNIENTYVSRKLGRSGVDQILCNKLQVLVQRIFSIY